MIKSVRTNLFSLDVCGLGKHGTGDCRIAQVAWLAREHIRAVVKHAFRSKYSVFARNEAH